MHVSKKHTFVKKNMHVSKNIKMQKKTHRCAWLGELDSAEESDEISNEFDFKNEVFSFTREHIFLVVLLTVMLAESKYLLIQVLDVDEKAKVSIELEVFFSSPSSPASPSYKSISLVFNISIITIMTTLMSKASSEESMQMMPASSKELNSSLVNIQRWSPGSRKKLVMTLFYAIVR